jgi:hypothetical protein
MRVLVVLIDIESSGGFTRLTGEPHFGAMSCFFYTLSLSLESVTAAP